MAEAPGSGYSQSTSIPSSPYWLATFTDAFTKVVREVEFAARVSKGVSMPPIQPPIESTTFTFAAWARETRSLNFAAFSMGCSVPSAFGMAKA